MKTVVLLYDLKYGINRMIKNYVFSFKNILRSIFFRRSKYLYTQQFCLIISSTTFWIYEHAQKQFEGLLDSNQRMNLNSNLQNSFQRMNLKSNPRKKHNRSLQYLLRARASVNNLKMKIITMWYNFSLERKLVWYWLLILILQKSFYVK